MEMRSRLGVKWELSAQPPFMKLEFSSSQLVTKLPVSYLISLLQQKVLGGQQWYEYDWYLLQLILRGVL